MIKDFGLEGRVKKEIWGETTFTKGALKAIWKPTTVETSLYTYMYKRNLNGVSIKWERKFLSKTYVTM